jgi:hypothetical protein
VRDERVLQVARLVARGARAEEGLAQQERAELAEQHPGGADGHARERRPRQPDQHQDDLLAEELVCGQRRRGVYRWQHAQAESTGGSVQQWARPTRQGCCTVGDERWHTTRRHAAHRCSHCVAGRRARTIGVWNTVVKTVAATATTTIARVPVAHELGGPRDATCRTHPSACARTSFAAGSSRRRRARAARSASGSAPARACRGPHSELPWWGAADRTSGRRYVHCSARADRKNTRERCTRVGVQAAKRSEGDADTAFLSSPAVM